MTKRTEKAQGTQAGNEAAGALGDVLTPLIAGMTATRAHLLEWVQAQGVVALQEVFATEAGQPWRGRRARTRGTARIITGGRTATEVTLGERRIQVARVPSTAGQEAVLPSVAAWRERDPLTARVLEQILLGVSTRGYAGSLEAGPPGARSRGTSRSAVSRTLRGRLTGALTVQLAQRLEGLELLALFPDGVVVAGQTVIVVLGLTRDGEKKSPALVGRRLGWRPAGQSADSARDSRPLPRRFVRPVARWGSNPRACWLPSRNHVSDSGPRDVHRLSFMRSLGALWTRRPRERPSGLETLDIVKGRRRRQGVGQGGSCFERVSKFLHHGTDACVHKRQVFVGEPCAPFTVRLRARDSLELRVHLWRDRHLEPEVRLQLAHLAINEQFVANHMWPECVPIADHPAYLPLESFHARPSNQLTNVVEQGDHRDRGGFSYLPLQQCTPLCIAGVIVAKLEVVETIH